MLPKRKIHVHVILINIYFYLLTGHAHCFVPKVLPWGDTIWLFAVLNQERLQIALSCKLNLWICIHALIVKRSRVKWFLYYLKDEFSQLSDFSVKILTLYSKADLFLLNYPWSLYNYSTVNSTILKAITKKKCYTMLSRLDHNYPN